MSVSSVREVRQLDKGLVLSPERYHPLREQLANRPTEMVVGDCVREVRDIIPSKRNTPGRHDAVLCFDTCDARNGFLELKETAIPVSTLQSAKKAFKPGDVIISRLRPYLRQVAFVPPSITKESERVIWACSSEFFVLRGKEEQKSIAFLVPLLLAEQTQRILAAGQEGGHHPRFKRELLLSLPIPRKVWNMRNDLSSAVESLANQYIEACRKMNGLVVAAT